ncbi:MAG TPA: formyltransferase family protein [Chitinophagaceae bacterium]|jgi:methionyl-tRNA formyltransferase|nr:formyltransferase family protein [Chitinophagaceae bacterium]HMU59869.1 formyltransferase family protein [Chitinophagaceae bacterium]
MNNIKIILLCNNPVAVPGIREFLFHGNIAAVCIPEKNKEMQHILNMLLKDTGVPLLLLSKKDYRIQLADAIEQYKPDIGVIMTFPYVLPAEIITMPAKGFVNFHYGLLPACRGPQPILWHLLNNDTEAGVTLHQLDAGIDTGPVITQEKIPIAQNDTYGTLQTKLAYLAAKLSANFLKILSYGTIIPSAPQDESKAAYYNMPGAKELTIDWKMMSAEKIIRLVNACNPWNKGAGTSINNWVIGITEAEISEAGSEEKLPGTIIFCDKANGLTVQTSDNKKLIINIIYTNEGFFSGWKLGEFGVSAGMMFT